MSAKITQLLPADGWYSVHYMMESPYHRMWKVAGWAVLDHRCVPVEEVTAPEQETEPDDEDDDSIVDEIRLPVVGLAASNGVFSCEDSDDFVQYVHESELGRLGDSFYRRGLIWAMMRRDAAEEPGEGQEG